MTDYQRFIEAKVAQAQVAGFAVDPPEYLLLFRKPPTDGSNGYADVPVVKDKATYTCSLLEARRSRSLRCLARHPRFSARRSMRPQRRVASR